jgi:hypothetical protein
MFIQAGGHQLIKVTDNGRCIVKPTKKKELKFYQKTLMQTCPELIPFIPKFFIGGRIEKLKEIFSEEEYDIITKKNYKRFIKTENLLNISESQFCIIDIKLGKIHWKSSASDENIQECQKRNHGSTMDIYGLRLDGFVEKDNDQLIRLTKEECRLVTIEKIKEVLTVLTVEDKIVVSKWLTNLHNVIQNSQINIYGPSILILKDSKSINVKLIDFTTYEKCVVNKQFVFSQDNDSGPLRKPKNGAKRMRKFLVRYNKLNLLQDMHNDILFSLRSLINLLNS